MNTRRRLSPRNYLRLVLPGVATFICATVLFAAFGWYSATRRGRWVDRCLREYAEAHTPADSAGVDRIPLGGRRAPPVTCGELRREGSLPRAAPHAQAA